MKHFILGYEGDFTLNLNEFSEENITNNAQDKLLFVGAQASKKELMAVHGTKKDIKTVYDYLNPKKGKLTGKQLKEIFPGTSQARCDEVAALINKYADKFEITMPLRMAHFLGQIGTETGGLKESGLKESTCHRESTVMSLWGNVERPENSKYRKYCGLFEGYNPDLNFCETITYKNSKGKDVSVSLPAGCKDKLLVTDEVTIKKDYYWSGKKSDACPTVHLDYVYSCRMGNGPASSGDGSKYAGKGFIHLTGKSMYKKISDAWNTANPSNPKHFDGDDIDELVNNTETALLASLYYWSSFNLNAKSEKGLSDSQIDVVGAIINGTNPPNDYKKRRDITNLAFKTLK